MSPEELEEAIGTGDPDRVVAVLAGATEAERAAAAEVRDRWHERLTEHWEGVRGGAEPKLPRALLDKIGNALDLVRFGTGARSELRGLYHTDYARAFQVLADRRPPWLAALAKEALPLFPDCWPLIRRLERAGLIPRPEPELYTLGLIAGGAEMLDEDPDLLQEDLWLIFQYEGTREASLSMRSQRWIDALLRLSKEGRISRERLLDESLDALARDFIQFRAGWFSRFHEELSPTLEERAARAPRYLALLSSPIPPTVSFALKAVAVLDKADRLPAQDLLDHAAPALAARQKSTVTQTLKLLDRAARREPALAARAAEVAAEALLHEAPEVQGQALDLIERHGDLASPSLRAMLEERLGDVAASQRSRLEAFIGASPSNPSSEAAPADDASLDELRARARALPERWRRLAGVDALLDSGVAPPLELPFQEVPRLDPDDAVRPIGSLDELIGAASVLLESFEPAEEIERVLDGISRLCDERPEDFDRRTGPLRKRASKLFQRNEWVHTFQGVPQQDLPALILAWTTGELAERKKPKETDLDYFNGLRLFEIASRVARREARPLLALPTHRGGWIDPRVLVERVRARTVTKRVEEPADAVQALLRLAPDHRAAALEAASELQGELGDALRHALGAADVTIGPTAALWAAAARARSPAEDDPAVEARHPGLGPDTGRAARVRMRVEHESRKVDGETYHYHRIKLDVEPPPPKRVPVELPTVLHHVETVQEAPARRWCATIWPSGRSAWFARGVDAVGGNLDWWEAVWSNRVYLEALLEPDTPPGEMGRTLLALGLAAKEPGEASLSVDALILSVRDGRIDAVGLGETLAALPVTGLVKGARWAKTLGEAARASALHREVVREALERLLVAAPELRPVDLGALLTLLQELCVESSAAVRDEQARAFLATFKSGKSGTTAKALLQLQEGDRTAHLAAAASETLTGRLERAERWMRMTA